VERWITQRLAHRLGASAGAQDGVCANIDFPFPAALVATATAAACGLSAPRQEKDPWAPERAVWPLLQLVDEHLANERMWPLAAHILASSPAEPGKRPRRFTTARHLADLYDRYAVYRPEMLLHWKEGAERDFSSLRPDDIAWQAELWRYLRDRLGCPSPAERFQLAPPLIEAQPELLDLPKRISLFGLTRLPASYLRVLKAIAAHRDVHLFLLHPSGALWDKTAAARSGPAAGPAAAPAGAGGTTSGEDPNPLLRSWGRDAREMQEVLAAHEVRGGEHRPVVDRPSTLLGLIQADVRADRSPPAARGPTGAGDSRPVLASGDDSLRVHSCHGRARQVEVVREAVLHLLAADGTLEPRDVIVMCPDIELFAPLVQASFGAASLDGAPELRACLADRSLRQTNPLLAVASQLLEIAGSRVTASQVLDLASREPVCRRFGFDEDDLSQIERWLSGTGTRWGLDEAHRKPWKLTGAKGAGTWQAGLDRLLLGVAMSEDGERLFGGTLPFGDISTSEIDLVGRFAELVERLRVTFDELDSLQSPQCWAAALLDGTARVCVAAPGDEWQTEQLRQTLDDVADEAQGAGPEPPTLDLAEARALLSDRLRGRPTRAGFRTGDMTICTLVPMRSVPHRVVCLLGLDDGLFPRPAAQDGDDLLLASPQVGDRDGPREDRQLLLDALLAATEHLVITLEGRDQHLNQRRPPAVPVAELLDVVDRTVRLEDGARPAREKVLVDHPLQPFDPANFTVGRLGAPGPWRFDQAQLGGAKALRADRPAPPDFLPQRLPPLDGAVQLAYLVRFLEHPVKAFLRERLGFYAGGPGDQLSDSLPIELGPLERWALGDRLLETRLAGASLDRALAAERARGLLPPGPLGDAALAEVEGVVEALVAELGGLASAKAPALPVEINVGLPDGSFLVGTVPGVHEGTILRCTYSKLRPKHRLRAWAQFLALSAAHPELEPSAITIGQAEGSTGSQPRVSVSTLSPLGADERRLRSAALGNLQVVVDLYRLGMREPLPIYCATSAAWAAAPISGHDSKEAARSRWTSSSEDFPGEDSEPEHVAVLGPAFPFEQLIGRPAEQDESGPGWEKGGESRFGRLAMRLWGPLLAHEHLRDR
jgi:exodeoxyribonuclease V gamma subunit